MNQLNRESISPPRREDTADTGPPREAVILTTGVAALIRRATPADLADLETLHDNLSPTSIRHRYLAAKRPNAEVAAALAMPRARGDNRLVAVGSRWPKPVAFGYYVVTEPGRCGRAELGMVVADRFQGMGVGRALFRELALAAREDELAVLQLQVSVDNAAAIAAFRGAGIPHRARSSRGLVDMSFDLTLSDRLLDD
ncbi:GNAT family N-acetyltransferase [Ectothiorhodospiraceae bacterium WFHF3C12]|nr:GNAT family N-acetyltransferase [Ectothiorhodospiraceae bacterium WFHF3C12]